MDAAIEIVVTGHHIAGPDRYRSYVAGKLADLGQLDRHIVRYEVELSHEPNPRQSKSSERVVITSHGKGPGVRVEAHGSELSAVLDDAIGKLEEQLRRNHERRVHRRSRNQRASTEPDRT